MNQAPFFNAQFAAPSVAGVAAVAAGYLLYTWASGTTTPQTTYQDQGGTTPNTNPIVLDDDGRCNLWLDPSLEYTIELRTPLDAVVKTWDDVSGAANTAAVVTSVNGATGAVVFDASGVDFAGSGAFAWLTATDVESAIEQVADRANAPAASTVTIVDAGGFFTGTDVEAALQQLGDVSDGGRFLRLSVFTASALWTKGADVGSILVEGVGGGGAGAGGGGGGAGGYFKKHVTSPAASVEVTVGAGGTAGAAGGETSFGSVCLGSGGAGGAGTSGASGGSATGGDVNLKGGGGASFRAVPGGDQIHGMGGSSFFGGAGKPGGIGGAGESGASGTGGGGGGGGSANGSGGSGIVIIHEYT